MSETVNQIENTEAQEPSLDYGKLLKDMLKHKTMLGAQLSYYYNSIFGPLGGSIGYSNLTKRFYYYINLGFVF